MKKATVSNCAAIEKSVGDGQWSPGLIGQWFKIETVDWTVTFNKTVLVVISWFTIITFMDKHKIFKILTYSTAFVKNCSTFVLAL